MNALKEQLGRIRGEIATLSRESVSYKLAEVTAVDTVANTFTAQVGDAEPLAGISAPAEFMPSVGQTVRLTINGATPLYEPAQIAYLAPEKAVAGTISANWIVAGGFFTALTGQRTGMTPIGFQAWNASNVLTVNIDGVNNLMTGTLKTAASGRRIEIGASGALGEVNFYAPTGAKSFLRGYTESGGVEAAQFGMEIASTNSLWNRINYNSDEWANYRANKHDFYFGASSGYFIVRYTADRAATPGSPARFQIDATTANFWNPEGSGLFSVSDRKADTTTRARLQIDGDGAWRAWRLATFDFSINDVSLSDSTITAARFRITDTDVWHTWANTNARIVIRPSIVTGISARIQLVNESNVGATIRHRNDAGVSRLEVTDVTESAFAPVWASAFTVSSSEVGKGDVQDLADDPVKLIQALRVVSFRRRVGRSIGEDVTTPPKLDSRREIGVIAEDTDDAFRVGGDGDLGPGVDLGPVMFATVATVQNLIRRLEALENKR